MFDKKCTHDEAKVELKKYIDNVIQDKMSWYDDELKRLRFRLGEIEKEKTGRVNFKYLEKNLTVTEAIARLKDGRALRNEHFKDYIYIVARFETHIKSKVAGYQVVNAISGDVEKEFYMIPKGKYGCLETGWSVIDV